MKEDREVRKENFLSKLWSYEVNIDPSRLMGLCDGIFGMVMTLLIFSIEVPDVAFSASMSFKLFLINLLPTIGRYSTCFILVGAFWIYHHEYIRVDHLTVPFIWLNLFYLLSVSFVPLTTMIMGKFTRFLDADLLFGANILLIVFFLFLIFKYAEKVNILDESFIKDKRSVNITLLIIVIVTVIVTGLNFTVPGHYIYLYLLIPIISSIRDVYYRVTNDV